MAYQKKQGMEKSERDRHINFNSGRKWKKAGAEGGMEEFVRAARGHWAIESYHWILDVTFREDANKTLNKNAARNLNILRKLAISILEELPFRKKFSRRIRKYIISKKIFKIIF